ncbi:apolipoprotein N-acyltransferase [Roseovarius pelagicus]|uniref:Apolipoprotein N-acyltransferase n=1 Tax=Roseovarius pelagicus TaxID=2980108 RepID=A0ABY6DAU7_9RHOB|nr:apolipoprotein N-acyltransferase [Roseovarius pelagicus]UXX83256.1 apolipoprotein N-acyltransferase [Roseovarius pelagicus]
MAENGAPDRFATWVCGLRPRGRFAICAALGAVAGLGQAPFGLWPLTVLALAGIYGIFGQRWRVSQAALIGLASGTGYFLVALAWMVEPFLVDAARHGWMAPFALILCALGFGLFWAAAFGLARWVARHSATGNALAWIGTGVLAEWLRGTLFTGFPWAQTGHVWIGTPMMHWAAIGGALLLCAISLGAGVALWHTLIGSSRVAGGLGIAALSAAYAFGPRLTAPTETGLQAPVVRLVQPNAAQRDKWNPDKMQGFFDRQVSYTGAATPPDLVVWPETSVPVLLNNATETLGYIADAARGAPVVLGFQRRDGLQYYNTAVLLGADGTVTAQYDKHHLVPFGEYMPLGDLLAKVGIHGLASKHGGGFSAGPGPTLIEVPGVGEALPLICYEGIFARNVSGVAGRPDFLLMITNDAWFGRVSGPYQHLAQAQLRSVEQGLPMVRAANTGISAVIDPRGQIMAQIALGQAGWIDAPLPRAAPPTPYALLGDWLVLTAMVLMVGAGAYCGAGRRRPTLND